MTAAGNLLSSIGNTPLVELTNMRPKNGARILLKLARISHQTFDQAELSWISA